MGESLLKLIVDVELNSVDYKTFGPEETVETQRPVSCRLIDSLLVVHNTVRASIRKPIFEFTNFTCHLDWNSIQVQLVVNDPSTKVWNP